MLATLDSPLYLQAAQDERTTAYKTNTVNDSYDDFIDIKDNIANPDSYTDPIDYAWINNDQYLDQLPLVPINNNDSIINNDPFPYDESKALDHSFLNSSEFADGYGANVSDSLYVDTLYTNVLGPLPDAEGKANWLGQLSSGRETRAEALLGFAESDENIALFSDMTGVV